MINPNLQKCVKQGRGWRAQVCQGRFKIMDHEPPETSYTGWAAGSCACGPLAALWKSSGLCFVLESKLQFANVANVIISDSQSRKTKYMYRVFTCLYLLVVNIHPSSLT